MKNYVTLSVLTIIFLTACKGKKDPGKEKDQKQESPISALSIINGQLNHLDTSIYEVKKFETINNVTDSTYLKQGEIRKFAGPFLTLPDIADEKYYERYTEDKLIDIEQNALNITSVSRSDTAEIQKQIIIISLSPTENSKVQSIFIDRYIANGDSTIEQKLFWVLDSYFSIANIIEKKNQPEKILTTKVTWQ
ncbi:MAG TPA: hypothetical protein VJ765_11735 [Chitinophagaceae bacterium]|nr:hypothetical protein [Chitinophagaceae bacterium]